VEEIDRLDDPRVADYRLVTDAERLASSGLFVVEGRLGVRRLLACSRFRTRSVFVTPSARAALADALPVGRGAPRVYVAPPSLLRQVVGYPMHRGCLALAERRAPESVSALLQAVDGRTGPLVVLEDVTNPDNVGGVLRNAWAFGARALLLTPGCADPLYRKATRVSMGASLELPFARISDCVRGFERLRRHGYRVVACTPAAEAQDVAALAAWMSRDERVALALGTEDAGLSAAALAAADAKARIPMAPGVDSLNVATAAGIVLHRFARLDEPPTEASPCDA
jgi:tRNA G18 (ribose-2'-O)-methylase SpoU